MSEVYDSLQEAIESKKHIYQQGEKFNFLYCPHTEEEIAIHTLYNYCPICAISIGSHTTVTHPEDDYWVSGYVPI